MKIIAIDPGNQQSGYVLVEDGKITDSGVIPNSDMLRLILLADPDWSLAIEWIQAMGMAVGKEVFETCLWVGRFVEAFGCGNVRLIPRGAIKLHHCGSARAKDGNIAQALKDKYGEKGTKKAPGYFFGVSSHAWQAFAVAAYVMEGGKSDNELRPLDPDREGPTT